MLLAYLIQRGFEKLIVSLLWDHHLTQIWWLAKSIGVVCMGQWFVHSALAGASPSPEPISAFFSLDTGKIKHVLWELYWHLRPKGAIEMKDGSKHQSQPGAVVVKHGHGADDPGGTV